MTHEQTIGERLAQLRREKAARERRDLSQAEIGAALGVSISALSRWETGRRAPSEADLIRLGEYYGVTPAYLRYGVQDSTPLDRLAPEPELPAADLLKQKAPARTASAKKRRA